MVAPIVLAAGISALAGGASSAFGASQAANQSSKQADKANDFTQKTMKKRHQWEVKDLKAAGLNPILSAGGSPPTGTGQGGQGFKPDVAASAAALANTIADTNLKSSSAKNQDAQADLTKTTDIQKGALSSAYGAATKIIDKGVQYGTSAFQRGKKNLTDAKNYFKKKPLELTVHPYKPR